MKKEQFPGAFITLEGPDGSGKTSNVDYLAEQIRALGHDVVLTREPGGSQVGEMLRKIVIEKYMPPMAELLVMFAARADHVETLIKPAMRQGKVVISDRFVDSTYAYQGHGRDMAHEVVELERLVLQGFRPDLTLFFDVSLDESLARLRSRPGKSDRFDAEEIAFRQAVWAGYQYRFNTDHHNRMRRIDAMQTPEEVRNQVRAFAQRKFYAWAALHKAKWEELHQESDKNGEDRGTE
jgi:dTMP kinase